MTADTHCVPNHHAHHPSFAGLGGLLAAASMLRRGDDARLVATLADLRPGDTVVDIGCGPGSAVRYAASRGTTVTGVDPAPVMLRVARVLTRSRNARFVEGRADHVPLPDATASVIWTIASVHHWDNLEASLREISRVLQPGGRFVAVEKLAQPGATGLGSHGWTEPQAKAFGERCVEYGFSEPATQQHIVGRRTKLSVTTRWP